MVYGKVETESIPIPISSVEALPTTSFASQKDFVDGKSRVMRFLAEKKSWWRLGTNNKTFTIKKQTNERVNIDSMLVVLLLFMKPIVLQGIMDWKFFGIIFCNQSNPGPCLGRRLGHKRWLGLLMCICCISKKPFLCYMATANLAFQKISSESSSAVTLYVKSSSKVCMI